MRIFYASNTSPDAAFQSDIWKQNLYSSLVSLGHDVVEFDYDLYETFLNVDPDDPQQRSFILSNRPKVTRELLKQIKIAHGFRPVDVFFSYFYDACVLPEAIDEIASMEITTVNWYCNGSYQLRLVSEIAPHYDWCLVPEKARLKDYVSMGANPIYCQEAANPLVYKPYDLPVEYDVTFVGQAYGDRPAYIQYLKSKGIDLQVWGRGWPAPPRLPQASPQPETVVYGGGILTDDEMIRMFSRSKINLGFSTCGETHRTGDRILQVRLRDFEVPMSGGLYMVEYMEELAEFFEIGKEIVCYDNREDLADKIRYYLVHESEREAIRWAGYRRCRRDHTWQRRFEEAFRKMGLV
jgi:spore maturation protein CgeB